MKKFIYILGFSLFFVVNMSICKHFVFVYTDQLEHAAR